MEISRKSIGVDIALENNLSVTATANYAISFTELAIQYFATQSEDANMTFT